MYRTCISFLLTIPLLISLTGCWDNKNIQDLNYVTALGIDYKDGEFIIYTQSLDFTNIAKQEGTGNKVDKPIWTAQTKGKTIDRAINRFFKSNQLRVVWDYITGIVLSERVLAKDILTNIDSLLRYPEVRYTPWVFGSDKPIDSLFTTPSLFGLSSILTILHNPEEPFKQNSIIEPIRFQRFVCEIREPGLTLLLPSLSLSQKEWKKNQKKTPQFQIDGIYAIKAGTNGGWFPTAQINGLRWMTPRTVQTFVHLDREDKPLADLSFSKPEHQVKFTFDQSGQPRFSISVEVHGSIDELSEKADMEELRKRAEQKIKQEIRDTYQHGIKKGIDLYSLKNYLYKQDIQAWKRLSDNNGITLTKASLKTIQVHVKLDHSGLYRIKK
ncbi:Ger(x)C family spore germination protein [Brevibacillus laterosporus]|uniref:Ger(x)C family spore germination protein n=1 Tax=Brevibacillus laterosporus TaxID=1465 RepID=UPI002654ED6F|nr:Ger(x)C family spore germination protein [Brevibacillus laterosporus]MDN9009944.1 Ger(x)C family spore germination protein [Brevibacillus laterosporus]MDO0940674.1 Ger(x)C family spore germination protein [Brevibacillus laterosporus]